MYPYPIGFDPLVIHIDQLTHGLSLASLKPHTEGEREREREREKGAQSNQWRLDQHDCE